MRKAIAVIGALAWFIVLPAAAAADDLVKSFEKFLSASVESTNASTSVFLNNRSNGWMKRRYRVSDLKYDVKRTDSLVAPIVGIVTFKLTSEVTGSFQSQTEAESSNFFDSDKSSHDGMSLSFAYRNDKWELTEVSYRPLDTGRPTNATFEISRAHWDRIPYKNWIPK
ncbi:MAG TPA: hypothetical protein VJ576_02625 [Rhodocyclaceae bacterium]|nr:hypothetical protein [Rhodocyclaceae bacterium]